MSRRGRHLMAAPFHSIQTTRLSARTSGSPVMYSIRILFSPFGHPKTPACHGRSICNPLSKRINIRAKGLPDVGVNFYRSKRKLEINIPPESAADN